MKYETEQSTIVAAEYDHTKGNPFLEALPPILEKETFMTKLAGTVSWPADLNHLTAQERRSLLPELSGWFQPMDYMYVVYDMLMRAIRTTYQSKSTKDAIRQINALYSDMITETNRSHPYATQVYSGALLGVPGIGKTSTIRRCLNLIPQVIIHTMYQEQPFYTKQINYLVIECPSDCSIKTMVFNVLRAIDDAIGSSYFPQIQSASRISVSALAEKLKIICLNHHVGLIVIDEIQNAVLTAKKQRQTKPLIRFMVGLTNETATGLCFSGTMDADEIFLQEEHLKRRTRGLRLLPMRYDETYRNFIHALWSLQITLQKKDLTEAVQKQIFNLTGGIPDYIVKLMEQAQVLAILSGREQLSAETIRKAAIWLNLKVPAIYGKRGLAISDFSVQEVAPEVMEDLCEDTLSPEEQSPISRFYAKPKGRPTVQRDPKNLVWLGSQSQDSEQLVNKLMDDALMERWCIL